MPTIDEVIAAVNEFATDDAKAKELAERMRKDAASVAQPLLTAGAGRKAGELQTRFDALTKERDDAVRERDEAHEQLETARKSPAPDLAAIEQRHKDEIKTLKDKHKGELKTKDDEVIGATKKGAITKLTKALIGLNVDKDYATYTLAAKHDALLDVGEDRKLRVYRPGTKETYDADDEDQAIDALAADIRKTVKPVFITASGGEPGGGAQGSIGGGGGTGRGAGSGDPFEAIRQQEAKLATERATTSKTTTDRLLAGRPT